MKHVRVPLFTGIVLTLILAGQQAPGQEKQPPSHKRNEAYGKDVNG
ncbi:MAG TPA: hypothetical protein VGA01_19565 [Candidatus Binatia bacterium]